MSIRVRFAPSPTGPLHIGGVRTALYNYLFAKKHDGDFILRIEDTDRTRYVEGAEQYIINSLNWLGLIPDEGPGFGGEFGPYRQSERRALYAERIAVLVENGSAYYAFDTPEELSAMRDKMQEEGVHTPKYDHDMRTRMRNSLTLSPEEVSVLIDANTPYTVRLKVDPGHEVSFDDIVRGHVTFASAELDDKVLMKADGLPTYHFANVVDDHSMQISHVIRGEEWLSSTPHHVLLYRAFGWESSMPAFAHLPLILKPTGKGKLSKRDGDKFGFPVFPLDWEESQGFKEVGFTSAGLLNFLAFLGWNPGTEQEIFDLKGLVEAFELDNVVKSGARFDFEKALWFNGQHIKEMNASQIASLLDRDHSDRELEIIDLYKDRVARIEEFVKVIDVYTQGQEVSIVDPKFTQKKWNADLRDHFEAIADLLQSLDWNPESIGTGLKEYITEHSLKFGDVFRLLRVALSGSDQGPDIARMFVALGKEESIKRVRESLAVFDEIVQHD